MKHYLNFDKFNIGDIYVTSYMNESIIVFGNKLLFKNNYYDISTPIYESNSKQLYFICEDTTLMQDLGSGLSNLGSNIVDTANSVASATGKVVDVAGKAVSAVGNFVWDTIKFPSSDISTFQGMMDWGHWFTGNASLITMLVGIAGSAFSFGLSAAGAVGVAKAIDVADIGLYVLEFGNHLNNKNWYGAGVSLFMGGVMSYMLFSTPTGNSAFVRKLTAIFDKLPKPKVALRSLQEALSYILSKLANFKSKFKIEYLTKFFSIFGKAFDSLIALFKKIPSNIGNKFISFLKNMKTKVLNMVETVKSVFTTKAVTNFADNVHLNKFLDANEITKMRDLLGNDEKSIKIFVDIFETLGKTKDISYLKGILPIDKMPTFLKNVSKFTQKELDVLPSILEKSHIAKNIGDFTETELKKLVSDPKLVNLIDIATDPTVMKNYMEWAEKSGVDSFSKIVKSNDQALNDLFVKNKGNLKEIVNSSTFKKLGVGSRSNAFDALAKTVDKSVTTSFEKINLSNIDISEFSKKIFDNGGKISYKGRIFETAKTFDDFIKNGDLLGKQTQILNVYKFKTGPQFLQAGYNFFNNLFTDTPIDTTDGDNIGIISTNDISSTTFIKLKPVSERTDADRTLIKNYLKYILESSKLLEADRFNKTVATDTNLIKDISAYDLTKESNYPNVAKLFQAYINMNMINTEPLAVDGLIGEKTLNRAYQYFNMKNSKGELIGPGRAQETLKLMNSLK